MADHQGGVRNCARTALGLIRLFNGTMALFAPEALARRIGADPAANGAIVYPLRMFGIRTIVIGAELLLGDEERREYALRVGLLIHLTDVATCLLAGRMGHLSPRTARTTALISTTNVVLDLLAQLPGDARRRSRRR